MASAGTRLLLAYAGLLAVAVAAATGLGSGDADEPAGSGELQELPASAADHRMRRDTTRRPEPITRPRLDPWETWMVLLNHNKQDAAKKKNKGKGRNLKPGHPDTITLQTNPSLNISSEDLVKEFRKLINDLVLRRERLELDPPPEDAGEASRGRDLGARNVEAAFHCRLRPDLSVERRTLQEISGYYLPDSEGAFYRGLGLNLTSGQYTAPEAGFYSLAATLHVALPEPRKPGPQRPRDRLRLLICIESQCQHHASLEVVTGLPTSSVLFTLSVNGVLYLKMGQYTSVFLDNASGTLVTVQSGSQFSAFLLGI